MDIYETTMQHLEVAIKYNKVIDFLEGKGVYCVRSDPRDMNSMHAFDFCIECYNKYALEHKDIKLKEIFENEIITKLNSNDCNCFDIYFIFKCLLSQLTLEKSDRASFKVDKDKLSIMFKILREKIHFFESNYKGASYGDGANYDDGLLGYMFYASNKISDEIGDSNKVL